MGKKDAALQLVQRGFKVFPLYGVHEDADTESWTCDCGNPACASAGKHPLLSHKEHASSDPAMVEQWWAKWPNANIGVRTDGLLVVDVDYRSGGLESYMWLEGQEDAPWRATLTVETGNGFHEYYRLPAGVSVKQGGRLLQGVDFKSGAGNYVVGPGSMHVRGAEYRVRTEHTVVEADPALVAQAGARRERERGAVAELQKVPQGQRNDWLVWKVGRLRNDFDTEAGLYGALWQANLEHCEPPESEDRIRELARWAASLEGGQQVPGGFALPVADERVAAMASHVLTVAEVKQMPPPSWLVDGVVPEGGLILVAGHGGTKKSFLALDWMLCAATGHEWFGHAVKPGRCLYIAAEGVAGLGKRIAAWEKCRQDGVEIEDGFGIYPRSVNLMQPDRAAELVEIARMWELDYVVVDTLRRSTPGADENKQQDMGAFVSNIERLVHECAAKVIVLHHSAYADPKKVRGSSVLFDDFDVSLTLERLEPLRSELRCGKNKDGIEPVYQVGFHEVLVEMPDGETRSSLIASDATDVTERQPYEQLSPDQLAAVKRLTDGHQAAETGQAAQAPRERIIGALVASGGERTRSDVLKVVGGRRQAVSTALDDLVAEGIVVERKGDGRGGPRIVQLRAGS